MCNRQINMGNDAEIAKEVPSTLQLTASFEKVAATFKPNYNAAPGSDRPVIVENREGLIDLRLMHWGLIRPWSKPGMPTPSNARAETIMDKPMFKDLLATKRCLIPVAGYYEWQKVGSRKTPYHIRVKDQQHILIAGLYDAWRESDGEIKESYAMITTTPAESIAHIHHRMPVIIAPQNVGLWLARGMRDIDELLKALRPYPSDQMEFWPVGDRVNSTRNDGPDLIKPVDLVAQPVLLEV